MHVGFVTSSYPDDERDPRGIFVHRLARSLVKEGVDVTVVAPGSDRAPATEFREGVIIKRYKYWWSGGQRITRDLAGIEPTIRNSPWLAMQVLPLVARLAQGTVAQARKWDVVHAHWLYPAGLAAVATRPAHKLPVVITSHGGDLDLARRSAVFRWMSMCVADRADFSIAVNPHNCEMLKRVTGDGSHFEWMPVGVDEILPNNHRERPDSRIDTSRHSFSDFGGLKVLYVGSLVTRKSVATLLRSVAAVQRDGNDVALAIVGDGPELEKLEGMRASEGVDTVWFVGNRAPKEIPAWMVAADLLVLPSVREPWGSVVPEAMVAGTPAIVSETAGSAVLIEHGRSGFLIPEADEAALSRCLESYIQLSADAKEDLSNAARKAVANSEVLSRQIALRHLEIYRTVTAD